MSSAPCHKAELAEALMAELQDAASCPMPALAACWDTSRALAPLPTLLKHAHRRRASDCIGLAPTSPHSQQDGK
eukprot:CAMPEP_0171122886 /NCGR_PEP_ID=MMETSP0766_2-20121228/105965_1 /TAXON_ID=439317 /ORGANISM="Gambierdiscus australes, Strain CAWD 149" /LENGTH=73 /DNA_ID=CAMNT_0011585741 /DNA_START=636 /DNA_END=853 /DNA_ORIENTATION=-